MTKKIAVINDLSGLGRCSLTAAISVIAAMGVQPCPLPTAVLTAQTEYPSYYLDDYTDKMEHFRTEWQKLGQTFDGIYTGFVANERQIEHIFQFVDTFRRNGAFLLVDPVMGDDGMRYDTFTPKLLKQMQALARMADIITPNVTELCLLTGSDYGEVIRHTDEEGLINAIRKMALTFLKDGAAHIIVTGICFTDSSGIEKMGNLYVGRSGASLHAFPYIGRHYSGTGDLFASCIAAGTARGDPIPKSISLAGSFLEAALTDSVNGQVLPNDGVNYEKYLSMLL